MLKNEIKEKEVLLAKVTSQIERCPTCNKNKNGKLVPGEGSANAKVVFIGEAPGKEEVKTGRPFVGRAGNLLRSSIKDVGLKVEDIFITSPVKYLPKKITPSLEDIFHGRKHLFRQIEIIDPDCIVLLGRVAVMAILNKNVSVAKLHGTIEEINGKRYFISYHPAAPLHNPGLRSSFLKDFEKLKLLIKVKRPK